MRELVRYPVLGSEDSVLRVENDGGIEGKPITTGRLRHQAVIVSGLVVIAEGACSQSDRSAPELSYNAMQSHRRQSPLSRNGSWGFVN